MNRIPLKTLIFKNEVDVVVTDPCYIYNENIETDRWRRDNRPSEDVTIPYEPFIENDTIYGDWACHMIDNSSEEKKAMGEFCADSGMVCVTTMGFARWWGVEDGYWVKEHPWCVTVIPNFKGKAQITKVIDDDGPYIEVDLFSPEGDLLYYSIQTGL